jgi:predicted metal-dependent hydrolase
MQQTLTLADGQQIPYQLELRPRRTVGLKITQQGLVVHAPKRIVLHQLNQILQEKSTWIINKLALREANTLAPVQWQDGEHLLFLGQDIVLQVTETKAKPTIQLSGTELIVHVKDASNHLLVGKKVVQWYQQQAYEDFVRRVEICATKLGVKPPPVKLSNAQSRWGSCNSLGQVRLNWRLIQAPPQIIHYVVCHELAHLKEMNHSARFYAVLAQLFPHYNEAEKLLKELSPQLHRL